MRKPRFEPSSVPAMVVTAVLALGVGLAGCEKKGPAERAGEEIDQALGTGEKGLAEKTGEKLDDAAQEVKEESQQAAEKVEQAAEDIKN